MESSGRDRWYRPGNLLRRIDNLHRRLDDVLPRQFLTWAGYVLLALLLAGGAVYWLSIPGKALNSYNEAARLYDAGKYSNALYAATEALRDRGLRLKAYRLRADIYRALQQPQNAVADMTRVIELQPGVAENHDFRAKAYLEMQDPASAVKDYTAIIALKNSADAYNDRGLAYVKLNDTRKAASDFTKAIELEPTAEFYLQRGLEKTAAGDQKEAIADFDRALELESRSMTAAYCYRARAVAKRKSGDAPGSAADMDKALTVEGSYSLGGRKPTE